MDWFDPEYLVEVGGVILFLLIVYAESGLLIGIVLPGDSILISAGFLYGTHPQQLSLLTLLITTIAAAFAGYCTGYGIGFYFRGFINSKQDTLIFKKRYISRTKAVFRKYKWKTYLVGRFIPIVRTFIPVVAGMIHSDFRKFLWLNFISSIVWTSTLILSAYYVGKLFPEAFSSIEWIATAFLVILSIPIVKFIIKLILKIRHQKKARTNRYVEKMVA